MAKGDSRVFIEVEGGLVVAVWSSDPDMCATVIDHDTEGMDDKELEEHDALVAELEELKMDGTVSEI